MTEKLEFELEVPDIGNMFLLSIISIFSGIMFITSIFTATHLLDKFFTEYTEFASVILAMDFYVYLSIGEIIVFIISAGITFVYFLIMFPYFKSEKVHGYTNLITCIVLLILCVIEIGISMFIATASNLKLLNYMIAPLTVLSCASIIFISSFLMFIKDLIGLVQGDKEFQVRRKIRVFYIGIWLYVTAIIMVIVGIITLR